MTVSLQALGTLPEWDLTHFYESLDSPHVRSDIEKAHIACQKFEDAYKGKLAAVLSGDDAAQALFDVLREFEALQDFLGKLYSYAGLTYSTDTSDAKRSKFYGDVQSALNEATTHLLFFTLELNRLDEDTLKNLCEKAPLSHYKPWIEDVLKEKPYQLDDKLEQLFHEKAMTGRSSWNRLFDDTIAAMRFNIDGETLSIEPALTLLQDRDGEKRRKAGEALAAGFADSIQTFTLITNVLAKDQDISNRWRGFDDIAASRHLSNRVEPEVVDALVKAVSDAYPRLSHRYYRLKAQWFGRKQLEHWDRNAPLPEVEQAPICWDDARELVLSAYGEFSPEMARITERFFNEGWIDAPVRKGKAPGAFAHPTVPSMHPYVLLNYQGKPRDVMTLAHELGHGVHQVLAAKQGALMAPTPLTLAETASVFGEMLTFRKLLRTAKDVQARKALLASKVEDMINTVVRQIAFYQFERKVHEGRQEGELTSEALGRYWMEVQQASLGDSIHLHEGYQNFWAYIPHFIHSPFYVYAYAFGDCLVNSLYAVYEQGDEGFVGAYFDMLKAGGTKHHSALLKPFGLDAREPSFWQKGLLMLEGFIDELEHLEA